MREVALLAGRHLRELARSRGARLLAACFGVAVLLSLGVPEGEGATQATTLALLASLAFLALLVAAAAGTLLPGDRGQGREEWLSSLAPGGALRRLAPALAIALILLLGLPVAGAAAALAAGLAGRGEPLRSAAPIPLDLPARLAAPREGVPAPLRLVLPSPSRPGDVLEAETRALVASRAAAMDVTQHELGHVRVAWSAAGVSGEVEVSRRAPLRIDLPAGSREVTLTNHAARVHLRLEAARVLGGTVPRWPSLVLGGLLLALAAASLVPAAIAVSRATSAPTAAGVAVALAVLGGLRAGLLDLEPRPRPVLRPDLRAEAPLEPTAVERTAWQVLRVASHVAPDFSGLAALADPAGGRALSLDAFRPAAAWIGYGAIAALLVAWPLPRRRR